MNLNSLVALDALLRTTSVTHAAREIGITQSAMSHHLASLRAHFGDPLLVRSGRAMECTPRAKKLMVPLRKALSDLKELMHVHAHFDPKTTTQRFRISATQHIGASLLPPLMERLALDAPGLELEVRELPQDHYFEALELGQVDLVLGVGRQPPASTMRRVWLRDSFCTIFRSDHPALDDAWDLDNYLRQRHLVVCPIGRGGNPVDVELAKMGKARNIALRIDSFVLATQLVARSDLISTIPRSAAEPYRRLGVLQTREPALALPFLATISLFWHESRNDDPALCWLRDLVWTSRPHDNDGEPES